MIGYVYAIRNHSNPMVYVGSTTSSIEKRFKQHKAVSKCWRNGNLSVKLPFYNHFYPYEDFYIELLEVVDSNSNHTDYLELREGVWIRHFQALQQSYNKQIPYGNIGRLLHGCLDYYTKFDAKLFYGQLYKKSLLHTELSKKFDNPYPNKYKE